MSIQSSRQSDESNQTSGAARGCWGDVGVGWWISVRRLVLFSRDSILSWLLLNFVDLCPDVGGVADIAGAVTITDITDVICGDNV